MTRSRARRFQAEFPGTRTITASLLACQAGTSGMSFDLSHYRRMKYSCNYHEATSDTDLFHLSTITDTMLGMFYPCWGHEGTERRVEHNNQAKAITATPTTTPATLHLDSPLKEAAPPVALLGPELPAVPDPEVPVPPSRLGAETAKPFCVHPETISAAVRGEPSAMLSWERCEGLTVHDGLRVRRERGLLFDDAVVAGTHHLQILVVAYARLSLCFRLSVADLHATYEVSR